MRFHALLRFLAATPMLAACLHGAVSAKGDPAVIEEGALDRIVLKSPALPKDAGLIIRRFASDKADLGTAEKKDNQKRVDAARMIQGEGPRILAEAIVEGLSPAGSFPFVKVSEDPAPENSLVVEGRFTMINPGSRAKRYWGGFGAGMSGVAVEGTVLTSDGRVLAEFQHRRHSGIGIGGGDYVKFLTDDTRDVGTDIAQFLKRWVAGGDLSKEPD